jgi:hypothetical protein
MRARKQLTLYVRQFWAEPFTLGWAGSGNPVLSLGAPDLSGQALDSFVHSHVKAGIAALQLLLQGSILCQGV